MLRALRASDRAINLWIDQICIDQSSIEDKESQVKLMAMIYKRARNTIIWLGDEPELGAFRAMQGLHEATLGRDEDLLEDELDYLREPLNEDPATFQALKTLFERPWFQRTWVVQEAVLSWRPYFMAGSTTISWEDFAGYCVSVSMLDIFNKPNSEYPNGHAYSGFTVLSDLYKARSYFHTHQNPQSMLSWLVDIRYAAVTLPVDKVFGILGLCSNPILPDYSKSESDLFREVTVLALQDHLKPFQRRRGLDENTSLLNHGFGSILSCVDHEPNMSPSWVPDWSRPRFTTALAYDTSSFGIYHAGGHTKDEVFLFHEDFHILRAKAIFVTTIGSISKIFGEAELDSVDPHKSNDSLRACIDFIIACQSESRREINFQSVCATLVAGKDGTGKFKYPDEYIEIVSLLCDETTGCSPSLPGQPYTARQRKGYFGLKHLSRRKPGRMFQNLRKAYRRAMLNRRCCWTSSGLGLVPRFAEEGDNVVVFPGQAVPFVLRRCGPDKYVLIGECYVHDLMDGIYVQCAVRDGKWIDIV